MVAAVTSPMPGMGSSHRTRVVADEDCAQLRVGPADLDGVGVDEPQAGVQPTTGAGGQLQFGQPAAPGRAEQGGARG
jgi:hypothetical protein